MPLSLDRRTVKGPYAGLVPHLSDANEMVIVGLRKLPHDFMHYVRTHHGQIAQRVSEVLEDTESVDAVITRFSKRELWQPRICE
jgi:hypothetical protein